MAFDNEIRNTNEERGERWEVQLRKGCLEMAILASLWQEKLYGLEILRSLADSKLEISEGTVYPILARLKADGLLQSEWIESEGGHPRKYYWLTTNGRRRARQMAETWEKFAGNVSALVSPLAGVRSK